MEKARKKKRVLIFDEEGLKLLAKKLVEIRKKKEMGQEELAHQSGLSLSQIARIETVRINPTTSTLFKLARALKIKPSELLDFELPPLKSEDASDKKI